MAVTRDALSEMKREAVRHNELLLLYSQMRRCRERIEPRSTIDDFLDELKTAYHWNVLMTVRRESIEHDTIGLLSAKGIPSVLLRGSAIARDLYSDPYCRTSSDVDILVRRQDVMRADMVLSGKGYRRCDMLPLEFWINRMHHALYHYPGADDLIEVHWNFSIPSFFSLSSEDIWAETIPLGKHRYRLSPTMTVIHLLLHHHMHAFRELKILTDLVWALYRYDDAVRWDTLGTMIRNYGLVKTATITLRQIDTLCGEWVARESGLRKFRDTVKGMGRREPRLLASYFRMNLDREHRFQDRRDTCMARFALDRWTKISRSFATSLFPLPEQLRELYCDQRSWMLPLHYSRFLRWRVKEWKG